MEVLAFNFNDHKIEELSLGLQDLNGVHLWVFNADKIPPHIGISFDDSYYSLKSNGIDEGVGLESITNLIRQKNIPTLRIEVVSVKQIEIPSSFRLYQSTVPYKTTCLEPIKKALAIESAETIHELLAVLYERNEIGRISGVNLPHDFQGIPSYSLDDIHDYLSNKGS